MSRAHTTCVAVPLVLLVVAGAAVGAAEEAGVVSGGRLSLDEYNADVWRSEDTAKVGVGLTIGDVSSRGWYWNYGGRLSWVQYVADDLPRQRGVALGGVFGGGFDPRRTVSAVGQIAVDLPFAVDGVAWQASAMAGARVRLTTSEEEQFVVTFGVYHVSVFGDSGVRDRSDLGLAVLFSTALLSRR